jgi:hypothetical protein
VRADIFDIQVCAASVGDVDVAFPETTTIANTVLVLSDILAYEVRCVKRKT